MLHIFRQFGGLFLVLAAFSVAVWTNPAWPQNTTCPTAAVGDSSNKCASTQFVQNQIAVGFPITIGVTVISGGTPNRVLYDAAGVIGEYSITGTGSVVMSNSGSLTTPLLASPALSGTVTGANTIPLGILAQSGANSMLGNWTGSVADVVANPMPSCPDTGGNHLNYVSGTGITCGTGLGNGITALTGDVTASGPGSVAATLASAQPGAHTWALGQTFSSAITYGGVTLSNSVTGTGSMVLGTSPSISGLTVTGSFTAAGLVTNAALANPATTVNGQTCTLGSTCTVTAAATSITVGVTTIGSGTTSRILYDNAGTLGEYTITGTGTVVAMQTSPAFTTPDIGAATGASVGLTGGSTIYNATAIPAGGTSGSGYKFTSTSNYGVFFGSGVPTLSAAQGSLYLRSDGTPYYNTNGSTGWTSLASGSGTVTSVTCGTGLTGGVITTTGTCAADIASASNFYSATASKLVDAAIPYTAVPTPAFSATPTFDFDTSASFAPGVMTANITSMTCNNLKPNQGGFIKFTQNGTGGFTTVYCSAFKFANGSAPAIATGANAQTWLIYTCQTSSVCAAGIVFNASWLLRRDIDPAANDNTPAWIGRVG